MFPISDSVKSNRFPFINISLIAITIVIFYLQFTSIEEGRFIYKYALVPATVHFLNLASLIPFITSIFLHGNLLHIISNMWFLWIFGDNVEGRMNPFFYIVLYLGSGIAGGLLQYLFTPNSAVPMLGASGAVAGTLGAYYVLFPGHKVKTLIPFFGFFQIVDIPASYMLGYWILLQLLFGALSLPGMGAQGGVAFFAHVGGFIAGILFAKVFVRNKDY